MLKKNRKKKCFIKIHIPTISSIENESSFTSKEVQNTSHVIQSDQKIVEMCAVDLYKPFSNIKYTQSLSQFVNNSWFVVGASSIGKSHLSNLKPCQDNHYCESIKEGWGIAVICDGAGSANHSEIGSAFVAQTAYTEFKNRLLINQSVINNQLPNHDEWQNISVLTFKNIYNSLLDFANEKNIDFSSLACTVIVLVFTPVGILSTHIGDGRAGYCNEYGQWKSAITPHKGEEANQTIFLTSTTWVVSSNFKMSDTLVPESRVINEKAIAFTLMSDGCEAHSFDCSKMDFEANKWIDPNLPSDIFFNPLLNQLRSMYENKVSTEEVTSSWYRFIEIGTPGLKDEPDDKTLIIGILV
jgi:serine/threonine protein phosphatase PrpC